MNVHHLLELLVGLVEAPELSATRSRSPLSSSFPTATIISSFLLAFAIENLAAEIEVFSPLKKIPKSHHSWCPNHTWSVLLLLGGELIYYYNRREMAAGRSESWFRRKKFLGALEIGIFLPFIFSAWLNEQEVRRKKKFEVPWSWLRQLWPGRQAWY